MTAVETAVVVGFAVLVALVCLYGYVSGHRKAEKAHRDTDPLILVPARGEGEQYTVNTLAGSAVVTRVWSDEHGGDRYEIETYFDRRPGDGDTLRLHYVAPHLPVVQRKLRALSEAHLRGEALTGERPES